MSEDPKRLLLIFLKEPIEGKVKTRLGKSVGDAEAVQIYRALVATLMAQLQWVSDCHYRFCFAPADAAEAMQFWLLPHLNHKIDGRSVVPLEAEVPCVDFVPQVDGDLGDRMESAFQQGFDEGFSQVCAIGSDCPFLSDRWIESAYLSGKNTDVTLGPTPDGGYYLISMNAFSSAPFRDIPWSQEDTLSTTLAKLTEADLTTQLLPELSDIDHESDWLAALETPLGARLKKNLQREKA